MENIKYKSYAQQIEEHLWMVYDDLSINEKINIKAKAVTVSPTTHLIVRVRWGCPWRFGTPYRMPIKTGKGYNL